MDVATLTRQRARIAEWMRTILLPGQVVEVRAFDPFHSRTFATAADLDALAQYAVGISGQCKGVYYTPNPLRSVKGGGKHGTALDADVDRRTWLLIDADPVRPKDTNATDTEHAAAIAVAGAVRDTLAARGFGGLLLADSGNGGHVMVPVELPNDADGRDMHKAMLRLLGERFGTAAVTIDPKTYNAARIWKLPATLAMKGPDSPERPHRYARLIDAPDKPHRFAAANVTALRKLLDEWGQSSRLPKSDPNDRSALVRRAMAYLEKEPPAVSGKGGHDRAFHVACVLVCRFGLADAEAFAAIQVWNTRCEPPWSEKELRHKLASAAKEPRTLDLIGDPLPVTVNGTNGHTVNGAPAKPAAKPREPEPWDAPIPLSELPPAEPFPVDVLPPDVRAFVEETAWACGVPTDFIAIPALAIAGGCIGNSRRLLVKEDYLQSAALYAAFVARPGSTKSAALRLVARPLYDAETKFRADHKTQAADWEATGCKGTRPAVRRCVTGGGTVEGIAHKLVENPRGLALVTPELSGMVAGMNQYKQGGKGNDRQFYLSCWDQSPFHAERVDPSKCLWLPRPFLSLVGDIQPDVLESLRGERQSGGPAPDDGFLDRFLFAYPPQPPEAEENWRVTSDAARLGWANAVDELLAMEPAGVHPKILPLSPTGRTAYQEFTRRHAAEVNADGFPDHLRGPWSKLRGYSLRLALILHCLDTVTEGLDESQVDGVAIERAARLVWYFKSHAVRTAVAMGIDPELANAGAVLTHLSRSEEQTFRFRDLYTAVRSHGRFPDVDSLRPSLAILAKHGYVRLEEVPASGPRGGRPASPTYEINPLWDRTNPTITPLAHNPHNAHNPSSARCARSAPGEREIGDEVEL